MNPVTTPTVDELLLENDELRRRLEEAEDALRALRAGEIDAVFVESDPEQVLTLETPENPYRLLVSQIPSAAVTLTVDGKIIVCNQRFCELLQRSLSSLRGKHILDVVVADSHLAIERLLRDGRAGEVRDTITLLRGDGTPVTLWLGVSVLREGALGLCLMVTDHTEQRNYEELSSAQEALRASEAQLAAELADAKLLQEISTELIREDDGEMLRRRILDAAAAIMHSDCASMQRLDRTRNELQLLASKGFHPDSAATWATIGEGDHSVCAEARRTCQRIFVLDVESPEFGADEVNLAAYRRSGIRSVQSTPLVSRSGDVLGMISTHWRSPHQPSEHDFRLFDVLARQAADLIERKEIEETLLGSQRQLQLVSDTVPALISYVDTERRYRFCNRAYLQWFGLAPEEIIGRTMRDVLGDEAWAAVAPHFENALAGRLEDFEVEAHYARGGTRWINAVYSPDRDPEGAIRGVVVMVTDITARKCQAQKLSEQARLLDLTNDAIIVRDPEDRVIYWNRGAEELYGYSRDEALGRNKYDLLKTEFPEALEGILARLHRDSRWSGELVHTRKNGERLNVSSRWVLDRDTLGGSGAILETTNDITARKAAEQGLRDADRRKDEFLATLAHELRNPLAPIRNAVHILISRGAADPQLARSHTMIDRQVRIMARLLDDLLDVSRISRNRLELKPERVDLRSVVDAAIEISAPLVEAGGHTLTVTLPDEPVHLHADPVRLAQVFANLLNNAAKYTDRAGKITLSAEREAADVVVSIKDTGIGISAQALPRVFEIFSQAASALDRAQGGLGIGLSLVKGLVELHGGSVLARSDGPGKGSEFVVRLPAVGPEPARTPPPAAEPAAPQARRRILVADDNEDSADSLAMLLKLQGHEVATAYDGEAALAAADAMRPDVALLDIGMPKLDGFELCRRIREQPWGNDVHLLAVTGWGQEDDVRCAEEAGFDQHLVKPVDLNELARLLASVPKRGAGTFPA
jgi:PAS domain S-box-containing protein